MKTLIRRRFGLTVLFVLAGVLALSHRPVFGGMVSYEDRDKVLCSTSGTHCESFSWSNCSARMTDNGAGHMKYVYCNACGQLCMIQSYGSHVYSSSSSTSGHTLTTTHRCTGDSIDGSKWGGCGKKYSESATTPCDEKTVTESSTQTVYSCSVCGKVMRTVRKSSGGGTSGGSGSGSSGGGSGTSGGSGGGTSGSGGSGGSGDSGSGESSQPSGFGDSTGSGYGSLSVSQNGMKTSCTYTVEMWHYSGGYWKIGDAEKHETLSDSQLGALLNIASHMNKNYSDVDFVIAYPGSVKAAISEKGLGAVKFTASEKSAAVSISGAELKSDGLHLSAKCSFSTGVYSFDDFVSGLNKDIPIVDSAHGANVYSVFGNGISAAFGSGSFSGMTPSSPYIHPSEIKDSSGAFKSGYSILLNYASRSSDGFSVGLNTFKNAGAVGLQFSFPFEIVYEISDASSDPGSLPGTDPTPDVPDDPDPTPDDPDDPDPQEPGTPTNPVDPAIPITPADPTEPSSPGAIIHRKY